MAAGRHHNVQQTLRLPRTPASFAWDGHFVQHLDLLLLLRCILHPAAAANGREGKFNVLPEEPDVRTGAGASAALPLLGASASQAAAAAAAKSAIGAEGIYSPWVQQPQQQEQEQGDTYSAAELAGLRAQLEALLLDSRADDEEAGGENGSNGLSPCA